MARHIRETFPSFVLIVILIVASAGCSHRVKRADYDVLPSLAVDDTMTQMMDQSVEKNYDAMTLLERAEAFYRKDNFIEAAPEYERFLELYPRHRYSDYAQFKLALCYFKQEPTIDRDPEVVEKAMGAFETLLARYPNSPYTEVAKEKREACREHLARYAVYIGRYYYKQGYYPAAIARFESAATTYPEVPVAGEALYYLALSYRKAGKDSDARETLNRLIEKYPTDANIEKAKSLLADRGNAGS